MQNLKIHVVILPKYPYPLSPQVSLAFCQTSRNHRDMDPGLMSGSHFLSFKVNKIVEYLLILPKFS